MDALTAWTGWRLVKWVSLAIFASGVVGTVTAESVARQRRLTFDLAVWGLVGSWAAGWMLMKQTERSMGEPWISAALIASLVALGGTVLVSQHGQRLLGGALGLGGLLSTVVMMTLRSGESMVNYGALAVCIGIGAALTYWAPAGEPTRLEPADMAEVHRGFRAVAWGEGLSAIGLLLIYMPLKYGAGINLDGGTGLLGWMHGALTLVYLMTLLSVGRVLRWSWASMLLGAAAAIVPIGTFAFEWWMGRGRAAA